MAVQTCLFSDKICVSESQATGFNEKNGKTTSMATHGLKIKSLTHSLLRLFRSQSFHKSGPEMVHRRIGRKVDRGISHHRGNSSIATTTKHCGYFKLQWWRWASRIVVFSWPNVFEQRLAQLDARSKSLILGIDLLTCLHWNLPRNWGVLVSVDLLPTAISQLAGKRPPTFLSAGKWICTHSIRICIQFWLVRGEMRIEVLINGFSFNNCFSDIPKRETTNGRYIWIAHGININCLSIQKINLTYLRVLNFFSPR